LSDFLHILHIIIYIIQYMYYSITIYILVIKKRKKNASKAPLYTKLRSRVSRDTILITAAAVN